VDLENKPCQQTDFNLEKINLPEHMALIRTQTFKVRKKLLFELAKLIFLAYQQSKTSEIRFKGGCPIRKKLSIFNTFSLLHS